MAATYVALKDFNVGKSSYKKGQPVNTDGWPFRRDVLLESQRFIKRLPSPNRKYRAARAGLRIGDVIHEQGQIVDHSSLTPEKIDQLVGLRHLVIDETAPQQPASTGKKA